MRNARTERDEISQLGQMRSEPNKLGSTDMTGTVDLVQAAASTATALGIFAAGWQLYLTKRQAVTQFEDQLTSQYREIARRLPLVALLGEELDDSAYEDALPDFYHYFDLSNEQAFLRREHRITARTWANWLEGIEQNLRRPSFARAWAEVCARAPDTFTELRTLMPPSQGSTQLSMQHQNQQTRGRANPTQ